MNPEMLKVEQWRKTIYIQMPIQVTACACSKTNNKQRVWIKASPQQVGEEVSKPTAFQIMLLVP